MKRAAYLVRKNGYNITFQTNKSFFDFDAWIDKKTIKLYNALFIKAELYNADTGEKIHYKNIIPKTNESPGLA